MEVDFTAAKTLGLYADQARFRAQAALRRADAEFMDDNTAEQAAFKVDVKPDLRT